MVALCLHIQREIYNNQNTNGVIDNKYKFSHSNKIKITFNSSTIATTVKSRDLLLFHVRVLASKTKREEYMEIITCMECYKLEHH